MVSSELFEDGRETMAPIAPRENVVKTRKSCLVVNFHEQSLKYQERRKKRNVYFIVTLMRVLCIFSVDG